MFYKRVLAITGTVLIGAAVMIVYLNVLDPKEEQEYRTLVEKMEASRGEKEVKPYIAKQERKKVQKHLIINQNGERLHVRLEADRSDLVLDHRNDSTEVVEHLYNVRCCMQEELYYLLEDGREVIRRADGSLFLRGSPAAKVTQEVQHLIPMQVIRYFESETASLHYKTDTLEANHVNLARYAAPSHKMINTVNGLKPYASGRADSIKFSLGGETVKFTAKQFSASFFNDGGAL